MAANPYKRPESVLIVVHAGAQALLLHRADVTGFWQSVTGSLDWDDVDPRLTAVRELCEETGIACEASALTDLGLTQRYPIVAPWRARYAPDVDQNIEHAFALSLPAPTPVVLSVEHDACEWVPFAQALARVTSWTNRVAIEYVARRVASPVNPAP